MAALYRDADLLLNPSRVGNTPNSILEALACGVPVVSANVGGVPDLVEHCQTAWLVPPDSPQEMAAGISRVLGDARLRDMMTTNGLELAKRCSWPMVKEQRQSLYHRLAGRLAGI
jgi:glycosyltransferase involved in cell wall biosynthesis